MGGDGEVARGGKVEGGGRRAADGGGTRGQPEEEGGGVRGGGAEGVPRWRSSVAAAADVGYRRGGE